MTLFLLAGLLSAAAAAAPGPAPAAAGVSIGVGTTTYTVSTLYTGDRARDPFTARAERSASKRGEDGPEEPEEIDIHDLRLNGILKDRRADYAVLSTSGGETLLLRSGKLYDQRRKAVPGVKGRIEAGQRRVTLTGPDGDVQRYTLGEISDDEGRGSSSGRSHP